jgi:predicted MFS family arabinose efflux permease
VFLCLYTVFFLFTGLNQLSLGTLQGKLIEAQWRGRLLSAATLLGVVVAVACAAVLIPRWLTAGEAHFEYLFACTGLMFLGAAGIAALLREPGDDHGAAAGGVVRQLAESVTVLRTDANFRRLALLAFLFGTSMMAFPHYQSLARQRLGLQMDHIVWWVSVQNIGTAIFSLLAGPLADRRGTRLAIRCLVAGAACVPLVALGLAVSPELGPLFYSGVFVLVGLTPITFRMLFNYTLEVTRPANHPRYLSTLSVCIALPTLGSPLAGWLIDAIDYEPVFCGISLLVFLGWLITFTLVEPRAAKPTDHAASEPAETPGLAPDES